MTEVSKRSNAGFWSSAKTFFLPVGSFIDPDGARGYPIDMRIKAAVVETSITPEMHGPGTLHVGLTQYALGCHERWLAGDGTAVARRSRDDRPLPRRDPAAGRILAAPGAVSAHVPVAAPVGVGDHPGTGSEPARPAPRPDRRRALRARGRARAGAALPPPDRRGRPRRSRWTAVARGVPDNATVARAQRGDLRALGDAGRGCRARQRRRAPGSSSSGSTRSPRTSTATTRVAGLCTRCSRTRSSTAPARSTTISTSIS